METTRKTPARRELMDTLEQLLHKKAFQKISVNENTSSCFFSREVICRMGFLSFTNSIS